jgi:hypothetical protein
MKAMLDALVKYFSYVHYHAMMAAIATLTLEHSRPGDRCLHRQAHDTHQAALNMGVHLAPFTTLPMREDRTSFR